MQLTRVVPVWVKIAGLLLMVIFLSFQIFGQGDPPVKKSSEQIITPGPSLSRGLVGKLFANTEQIATKFFSPVVEVNSDPTIIRTTKDKYYQDEETNQ